MSFMDPSREEAYSDSVKQVASEVLSELHLKKSYRVLNDLFFTPIDGKVNYASRGLLCNTYTH